MVYVREEKKKVAERKKISKEFKLSIVKDYDEKRYTALELSRLFVISEGNYCNWICNIPHIKKTDG